MSPEGSNIPRHFPADMFDEAAEQAFLGCLLADPSAYDKAAWMLGEFFYVQVHADIFNAAKQLRQMGRDFGPLYLGQFLGGHRDLIDAGGADYLRNLANDVVSPQASIKDLARHILGLHYQRKLYSLGQDYQNLALRPRLDQPPEQILADAERIIAEARNLRTDDSFTSAAESARRAVEAVRNPKFGISSGFKRLDQVTQGFKPGEVTVIAARPSMGKTAMALTLALNAAENGNKVLFQSLEMTVEQLSKRVLSRYSGQAVHSGEHDDQDAVDRAAAKFAGLPVTIDDAAGLTAHDICARAATAKRRFGLDILFVDYLGKIKPADGRQLPVYQVEEKMQTLCNTAKQLLIPVVVLSQLSREVEKRDDKRPQLSDLRDSGSIEQDADTVMFIYREEYYVERAMKEARGAVVSPSALADKQAALDAVKGKAELIIEKNRQNVLTTVHLKFSGREQVFHE